MIVDPGVQVKPIESDALRADRYLGEVSANGGVEPVAVHAEVMRGVAQPDQTG